MKQFFRILSLLCVFISFPSYAETILHYLIKNPDSKTLAQVAENFEIIKKIDQNYEVYVLAEKQRLFEELASRHTLLSSDVNSALKQHNVIDQYKDYNQVNHFLSSYLSLYPETFTRMEYGQSSKGTSLFAYIFNPNRLNSQQAKKILVTAATHGDELVTVEILLAHMKYIIENVDQDVRLQSALKDKILYFIPVVSPDSYNRRNRYVDGKDPNRAYPWPENENVRQRVDVIEQLIKLFDKEKFYSSLDLHAYGDMIMYPWGYTTKSPDLEFKTVFDQTVFDMSRENNYKYGQISTTIYVAKGNSADYYFWKYKTFALAAEIGEEKIPNYSKIPKYVSETKEMFYRYLQAF